MCYTLLWLKDNKRTKFHQNAQNEPIRFARHIVYTVIIIFNKNAQNEPLLFARFGEIFPLPKWETMDCVPSNTVSFQNGVLEGHSRYVKMFSYCIIYVLLNVHDCLYSISTFFTCKPPLPPDNSATTRCA